MRHTGIRLALGALFVAGATACADLEVTNLNDPDASTALASAGDVESLIAGAYNTWYAGTYSVSGPGMFLSNASFQHNAPWANFGMEVYGRIPRVALVNNSADQFYSFVARPWFFSYRAIAALATGLKAMEEPAVAAEIGAANVLRNKAYAKFVQGVAHATVAITYDQGFVVDETTDLSASPEPVGYQELMTVALGYFDQAIALAGQGSFNLPYNWMQAEVSSQTLVRLSRSLKARYRAAVARTPQERAAVDWAAVASDVDAGLTSSFVIEPDWDNGWYHSVLDYGQYPGWSQVAYWMYGMADQSGNYQRWLDLPLTAKNPNPSDAPVLIITPDTRFPQGATVGEQRANPGRDLEAPSRISDVWARPDRGTWRWSYYRQANYKAYGVLGVWEYNEVDIKEMRLLKAESLFRRNDRAGAAAIINETRVPAGLNATNAAGVNTSCVPKLPNGQCGDLLEMLKWEKRIEVNFEGLYGAPWYFDGRGWGDLWFGTPLHFPAPCGELQVLGLLPCYTFGGSNDFSSPGSTYAFKFEK